MVFLSGRLHRFSHTWLFCVARYNVQGLVPQELLSTCRVAARRLLATETTSDDVLTAVYAVILIVAVVASAKLLLEIQAVYRTTSPTKPKPTPVNQPVKPVSSKRGNKEGGTPTTPDVRSNSSPTPTSSPHQLVQNSTKPSNTDLATTKSAQVVSSAPKSNKQPDSHRPVKKSSNGTNGSAKKAVVRQTSRDRKFPATESASRPTATSASWKPSKGRDKKALKPKLEAKRTADSAARQNANRGASNKISSLAKQNRSVSNNGQSGSTAATTSSSRTVTKVKSIETKSGSNNTATGSRAKENNAKLSKVQKSNNNHNSNQVTTNDHKKAAIPTNSDTTSNAANKIKIRRSRSEKERLEQARKEMFEMERLRRRENERALEQDAQRVIDKEKARKAKSMANSYTSKTRNNTTTQRHPLVGWSQKIILKLSETQLRNPPFSSVCGSVSSARGSLRYLSHATWVRNFSTPLPDRQTIVHRKLPPLNRLVDKFCFV